MSIYQIRTNSAAMNALYNLNNTGNSLSTSMQRLSTGLRINSAADDPSGLINAKQFQAQITGLNQAISNSQDAMNYAKTADGALNQVNDLLNTARGLAVAASNTGTLSNDQVQADNSQLQAIISSISTIASNTQYGTKHLLDGSSGVTSALTSAANVSLVQLGGQFGGSTIQANNTLNVTVGTAATQATATLSRAGLTAGTVIGADSFSLNGQSFTTTSANTTTDVLNQLNAASDKTGVTAALTGGAIVLTQISYGANSSINFADSGSALNAGAVNVSGTNAVATFKLGAGPSAPTETLTAGTGGADGLSFQDANGNRFKLTSTGNVAAGAYAAANVTVGSSTFQIGANVGQTTSLSLGNFNANQLGTGVTAGQNLTTLDLTTSAGAQNAISIIDNAISQVTTSRGQIGSFQSNVLNPNMASLNIASQNLSSSLSNIQDTNVAQEMTNFTQLQILQQAGVSVLAQANSVPQSILKLLP